jgi:hypothetical protein
MPRHFFADLPEGEYDYFLLIDATTLDIEEAVFDQRSGSLVLPTKESGVVEAMRRTDAGIDSLWLLRLQGYLGAITSDMLDAGRTFESALSGTLDAIREEALSFYLQIATARVPPSEKEAVQAALRAEGLKAFLPKKLRYVELAARMSLLANAASHVEEFALYLGSEGYWGEGEADIEQLRKDIAVLHEADPHQVTSLRVGGTIVWST